MRIFSAIKRIFNKFISRYRLWIFEGEIHPSTWKIHHSTLSWAKAQHLPHDESFVYETPLILRGQELRQGVLTNFKDRYANCTGLRILIHLPSRENSPAGNSLFSNMIESIRYLGIPCESLRWDASISEKLQSFEPTVFLTSDHESYLSRIDWGDIKRYRAKKMLRVGLTASIEAYGNTPLKQRLAWAKKEKIDFYFSFRSLEYLRAREEYRPILDSYKIHSIEFGANPLHYFPIGGVEKNLDYIFFGSSNSDKRQRYIDWMLPILKKYPGFIDGAGWKKLRECATIETNSFLYARAKVGLNLHIDNQVQWASELNERTYILGACGVPQLIDNPKLLFDRFSKGAMFQADSPREYVDMFHYILESPGEAQKRASVALEEVYKSYTSFHRADQFIQNIADDLRISLDY